MSNAESKYQSDLGRPRRPAACVPRPAFTLVELLVVITILAILASMVLFALAASTESARVAKTKSTINKLNSLIMAKYESYKTRRVPVDVKLVATKRTYPNGPAGWAHARLDVIRELLRMEMPDGFTDIEDPPITTWNGGQMTRPAASQSYLSLLNAAKARNLNAVQTTNLQQAMCLYMIVTRGCDDPDVMEQFSSDEVANDSATGLSYFVDGWGRPIYFLRWAPAYVSPLQPSSTTQHDPFDPMNVEPLKYQPTYPLYPLIYSAGPDGVFDLKAGPAGTPMHYRDINNDPFYTGNNIPLYTMNPTYAVKTLIGQGDADGDGNDQSIDNITNHDIGE
jgi:prepilin-type N-terminal cleavage/methylation domain-containing protein